MKTRIFAAVLALLLLFSFAACKKDPQEPTPPAEQPSGGNTGTEGTENNTPSAYLADTGAIKDSTLTWEIYSDGTLYIKGTGDMPDMESDSVEDSDLPWNPYRQGNIDTALRIKKLVVEEGVTRLSEKAFSDCLELAEVKLPLSLTVIPFQAFANCRQLKAVSGGLGLVTIEENAFQGCTALMSISLSTPIRTVELGAFDSCGAFSIFFTGTDAEWTTTAEALSVTESGNTAFKTAMNAPRILPR